MSSSRNAWPKKGCAGGPRENDAPPPLANDVTGAYRNYYGDFDRAQGWATTTVGYPAYDSDGFVKYPDPRGFSESDGVPNFMVKVEKDATRDLRITVIGRSPLNPAAYEKLITLQAGTTAQMPATSAMRSVTNWDFVNQTVPSARVESVVQIHSPNYPTGKIEGDFQLSAGAYLTVGEPGTASGVRGLVARSYDRVNRRLMLTDLTLTTGAAPPQKGERIEMAAGLGAPLSIDYDNSGAINTTGEDVDFAVSSGTFSGSVRANGGLLWFGKSFALNLRSEQSANSQSPGVIVAPGTVRASGLMKLIDASATLSTNVEVSGQYRDGNADRTLNNSPLLSSDDASGNFPGNWGAMTARQKAQLVDDGWNRLSRRSAEATRQVEPFTPPDITAGGGLGRYRQLSKFSPPRSAGDPETASIFGYGQGIFIDNADDKERTYNPGANGVAGDTDDPGPDGVVGTADDGQMSEMTQAEMVRLWLSLDSPAPRYARTGAPAPVNPGTSALPASLEDQHLRGWIGPNEFQGRGALVEINDNTTITITLDARKDGTEDVNGNGVLDAGEDTDGNGFLDRYNEGPVRDKGWRDASGARLGDSVQGGVYTRTFDWPEKGVIFAEGNIRIRGTVNDPPRSLTVVSMNNIYIEDSLSADADDLTDTTENDNRKILLLARKNVVLNPTRVVARPEAQSRLAQATGGSVISVYDPQVFRQGEWVVIRDTQTGDTAYRFITKAPEADGAGTLTLNRVVSGTGANRTTIRTVDDSFNGGNAPSSTVMGRIEAFDSSNFGNVAIQRRFPLARTSTRARLAFSHSAERRPVLTIPFINGVGTPPSLALTMKLASGPDASVLNTRDKFLSITTADGATLFDRLGILAPGDARLAENPPTTTNQIALSPGENATKYVIRTTAANAADYGLDSDVTAERLKRRVDPNWRYAETPETLQPVADRLTHPDYSNAVQPYYFLASVGNRSAVPGVWPYRAVVMTGGGAINTPQTIPMATSVQLTMNGADALLQNDRWNNDWISPGVGGYETVAQFGFNPRHGVDGLSFVNRVEDVLTSDQNFYGTAPTLDSRILTTGSAVGPDDTARVTLRFNNPLIAGTNRVADFFANSPLALNRMPYYALSRLKLENLDQLSTATHEFERLEPGHTINVDAFVYAQTGSWFVIPSGYFSDSARNGQDLDRNGTISRAEQIAGYRFHRYNYKLNFTGAIMEHHTAIVNTSGTGTNIVHGAVSDWMNKWATTSIDPTNFPTGTFVPTTMSYANDDFPNITYTFDDEVARGKLDDDEGFQLPIAPELSFQG